MAYQSVFGTQPKTTAPSTPSGAPQVDMYGRPLGYKSVTGKTTQTLIPQGPMSMDKEVLTGIDRTAIRSAGVSLTQNLTKEPDPNMSFAEFVFNQLAGRGIEQGSDILSNVAELGQGLLENPQVIANPVKELVGGLAENAQDFITKSFTKNATDEEAIQRVQTLSDSWKKVNTSSIESFTSQYLTPIQQTVFDPVMDEAQKTLVDGAKKIIDTTPELQRPDFLLPNDSIENIATNLKQYPQYTVALALAEAAPSLGTALVSNLIAPGYGALISLGVIGGADTYSEAIEKGMESEDAILLGAIRGSVEGALEQYGLNKILKPKGLVAFADSYAKALLSRLRSVSVATLVEGGTEGLQEFFGNVLAQVYDKERGLFEGVANSVFVGGLTGQAISASSIAFQDTSGAVVKGIYRATTPTKKIILPTLPQTPETRYDTPPEAKNALYRIVDSKRSQGVKYVTTTQVFTQPQKDTPTYKILDARTISLNDPRAVRALRDDQTADLMFEDLKGTKNEVDIVIDRQGNVYGKPEALAVFKKAQEEFNLKQYKDLPEEFERSTKKFTSSSDKALGEAILDVYKEDLPVQVPATEVTYDKVPQKEAVKGFVKEQETAFEKPFKVKIKNGKLYVSGKDNARIVAAQMLKVPVNIEYNGLDIANAIVKQSGYKGGLPEYFFMRDKVKAFRKEQETKFRERQGLAPKKKRITRVQAETIVRRYFTKDEVGIEFVEAIRTPSGRKALGKYYDKMITFIENPKETTPEHEVLHAYFDLFTSKERKAEILAEVEKRTGITDKTAQEEWLADEFVNYARGSRKVKTIGQKILAFFKEMLAKMKLLSKKPDAINALYKDIVGRRRYGTGEGSEVKYQEEDTIPREMQALADEAKKHATVEDFERAVSQAHLMDLSNPELHNWGRAFASYADEPLTDISQIIKDADRPGSYLSTMKYSNPAEYRAIASPGDTIMIYRAVPKSVGDTIRIGDYVALDKRYAQMHLESVLRGEQNVEGKIISMKVPKKDVVWGDVDFTEWAYSPQKLRQQFPTLRDFYERVHGVDEKFQLDEQPYLTTKILKKLGDRETVSKQFILDLTNSPDVKQVERELVRETLKDFEEKVDVSDFKKRVEAELLPLSVEEFDAPDDMGDFMEYNSTFQRYENITLPEELRGSIKDYAERIYQSPVKVSAGKTHFPNRPDSDYYFGHTRIEDMADNKTRRVIEVQSDLYQKGNLEKEFDRASRIDGSMANKKLTPELAQESLNKYQTALDRWREGKRKMSELSDDPYFYADSEEMLVKRVDEWKRLLSEATSGKMDARKAELSKLQQYNDPTAHFRMIREEIKKAAEDGKTKLQFPTGETAMKIEGLGENRNWWIGDSTRSEARLTADKLKTGLQVREGATDWIITDVLGDGKFKAVPKENLKHWLYDKGVDMDSMKLEDALSYAEKHTDFRSDTETFDISGKVDKSNPIYKFYEKDVARYLKGRYNAKPVTDENGVTWMEVEVLPEYRGVVEAFQIDDDEGVEDLLSREEAGNTSVDPEAYRQTYLDFLREDFKDMVERIATKRSEETQRIELARELLDSFDQQLQTPSLSSGYASYSDIRKRFAKSFNNVDFDPVNVSEMLEKRRMTWDSIDQKGNVIKVFPTAGQIHRSLFEDPGYLPDEVNRLNADDVLQLFEEHYENEQRLEEVAKMKTPEEQDAGLKRWAQKIVKANTVGRKMSTRQAISNIIKKSTIDPKIQVTMSEKRLLKDRMKLQVKIAREVAKNIRREVSDVLTKQFKKTEQKHLEMRSILTRLINLLPREARTDNMIKLIKNVKSERSFANAYTRINFQMEKWEKTQAIQEIEKLLQKILTSPSVAVDYKRLTKGLFENIMFTTPNAQTRQKLDGLRSYIATAQQNGESVYVPMQVLKTLDRLEKRSIRDLTYDELFAMQENIERINELGRLKLDLMNRVYNRKKQELFERVGEEIIAFDLPEYIKPGIDEGLTAVERLTNAGIKLKRAYMRFGMAIRPMDIFFDLYSQGNATYKTNFFRDFKGRIDTDYNYYLSLKDQYVKEMESLVQRFDMKESNMNRIGIYAAKVQENGIDRLVASGVSLEAIENITLTQEEMTVYEAMRRHFEDLYPLVKEHMARVYNKDLGKVDNYFPFAMDFESLSDAYIFERFGIQEDSGRPKKNVIAGATIERVKEARQAIKTNAYEVYMNHIDNATYMIAMGEDIKMLTEVAKVKDFKEKLGNFGSEILLKWLDTLARKGGSSNKPVLWLDSIRRNVGAGVMAFKLTSALVQPSAFADGAAEIGITYATRGATLFATDEDVRAFLLNNFPELKARVGDDPAFMELSKKDWLQKYQKLGFSALQSIDMYTASSITLGAYISEVEAQGEVFDITKPNKEAIARAQLVLRRTQNSSYFKDLPLSLSRGELFGNPSYDKIFFQFQTFMLNRWSYISYDLPLKMRQDPKAGVNALVWLAIATAYARAVQWGYKELLNALFGSEPDDTPFMGMLVEEVFQTIPLVSQTFSSIEYNSVPVPVVRAGVDTLANLGRVLDAKNGDTRARAVVRTLSGAGMFLGVPGSLQAKDLLLPLFD